MIIYVKLVQRFSLTVNICQETSTWHFLTCSDSETQNLVLHTLCSIFHRQLSQSDLQKTNIHEYSGYNLVNMCWSAHCEHTYHVPTKQLLFGRVLWNTLFLWAKLTEAFCKFIRRELESQSVCEWGGEAGKGGERVCACVSLCICYVQALWHFCCQAKSSTPLVIIQLSTEAETSVKRRANKTSHTLPFL